MELPKNVTQVGALHKSVKVYIEDYVISYLKQMNTVADSKRIGVALYGRKNTEDVMYCFIYGACKVDYLNRETKRLSNVQMQELEKCRQSYFQEYEQVGYVILAGESIEGIYILERDGARYVEGYSCFYEKNDAMLSFMLENRATGFEPEALAQEKYVEIKARQEDRRRLYEEGTGSKKTSFPVLQMLCASMFVILCLAAVFYTEKERGQSVLPGSVSGFFAEVLGEEPAAEEADTEALDSEAAGTLVVQAELTEEMQREGEADVTQEAMSQIVETPLPEPTVLPQETPVPTMEPTPSPTPEAVITPAPIVEYVICPGDTLISICKNHYGDESLVQAVCATNGISNPDNICVGQKIVLP